MNEQQAAIQSLQTQLIDVQMRVSYQDDTLAQLNDVIAEQDSMIQLLQKQMRALVKKHDEMDYSAEQNGGNLSDERPPHY